MHCVSVCMSWMSVMLLLYMIGACLSIVINEESLRYYAIICLFVVKRVGCTCMLVYVEVTNHDQSRSINDMTCQDCLY